MEKKKVNEQVQKNLAPECSCEKKRGRPSKKNYDSNALMQELIDIVIEVYQKSHEIKATAMELSLPANKVKKLLITGNVISYPETEKIQALLQQGKTMEEIQEIMGLSYSILLPDFLLLTHLRLGAAVYSQKSCSSTDEKTVNLWRGVRLKSPLRGRRRNEAMCLNVPRPLQMSVA